MMQSTTQATPWNLNHATDTGPLSTEQVAALDRQAYQNTLDTMRRIERRLLAADQLAEKVRPFAQAGPLMERIGLLPDHRFGIIWDSANAGVSLTAAQFIALAAAFIAYEEASHAS